MHIRRNFFAGLLQSALPCTRRILFKVVAPSAALYSPQAFFWVGGVATSAALYSSHALFVFIFNGLLHAALLILAADFLMGCCNLRFLVLVAGVHFFPEVFRLRVPNCRVRADGKQC